MWENDTGNPSKTMIYNKTVHFTLNMLKMRPFKVSENLALFRVDLGRGAQ